MNQKRRWDIFCKIVDNYGDIGVCWRLARQLQSEHGLHVRLWIDVLDIAKQIVPELDASLQTQLLQGVTVERWQSDAVFDDVADVVIEAFACELPQAYRMQMSSGNVWINLEYLSAESWVADFHAKNSRFDTTGLIRHFYFPGFTKATGGLIREQTLMAQRDVFWRSKEEQTYFWKALGVDESESLKASLFCYKTAPLEALFNELSRGLQAVTLLAPLNDNLQQFASLFGKKCLDVHDKVSVGNLTLQVLPFLSQNEYDKLLWACDINFVRGEDSWIRAVWAGKPFIWQPYPQSEDTHMAKLNAFLEVFYTDKTTKQAVTDIHLEWSNGNFIRKTWQRYLEIFPVITSNTLQQSNQLAMQPDLASKLVIFCNN